MNVRPKPLCAGRAHFLPSQGRIEVGSRRHAEDCVWACWQRAWYGKQRRHACAT